MYYYLIQSLKRRLILELKDSFSRHPVYDKIVPYIQNKYSFEERPQNGIIVKGSSANKVSLSADNFMGVVMSHTMLAYVGAPAYPLEWVREDMACIEANGGRMPTPPGVYYMEILTAPIEAQGEGEFVLDPLLTVTDEPVLQLLSGVETEAQLQQVPVQGTVRLYENQRFLMTEGEHYTIDYNTGAILLLDKSSPGSIITADYRYQVDSVGPIKFQWNKSDFETLPGVVMAFGKRAREGDKIAIVVYEDRVEAAKAYGGRFDVSFDMDVISRDPNTMEELADLSVMYLWTEKRDGLSAEGLEITDVSMGGETEEIYDETADDYYYNGSLSLQMQADWEVHVPMPLAISKINPMLHNDVRHRLFYATFPVIANRNNNFERIL